MTDTSPTRIIEDMHRRLAIDSQYYDNDPTRRDLLKLIMKNDAASIDSFLDTNYVDRYTMVYAAAVALEKKKPAAFEALMNNGCPTTYGSGEGIHINLKYYERQLK